MLHKSKDLSTNILNLLFKTIKVSIQKVIAFGWVCICEGKPIGRSLKVFEIRYQPNLNKIFKSYLGCRDLKGLCISPKYLKSFMKKIICYDKIDWPSDILCNFYIHKKIMGSSHKSLTYLTC